MIGSHGPTPWRLQVHDSLPSTSDFCVARARAGEPGGLAVLAVTQTAGRGSRGRVWHSPAGNLHLSVLLRPREPVARAGLWSLLAAVALRDALGQDITLKWPNDLLLHGRKLAGILLDSMVGMDGRLEWLVIGLGANLACAPEGAAQRPAAPRELAKQVLERLDYHREQGAEAVRAAWLAAAHPLGTAMEFRHVGTTHQGQFAGITEEGALILRTAGDMRAFSTGEVIQGRSGPLPQTPEGWDPPVAEPLEPIRAAPAQSE